MSLVKRTIAAIGSKINKLLDCMEDPRETLDYSYEKMVDQLKQVKQALVDLTTAKEQLKTQKRKACENLTNLEAQAKELIRKGGESNEKLARTALGQKVIVEGQVDSLTVQIKDLSQKQEKLEQTEKEFEIKVQQFNAQKETMKAQYTAAEAQKKIGESLSGISDEAGDVGDAMRRASDKTEAMTAKASAIDELTEKGVLTDALDNRTSIEKELSESRIKGKVDEEFDRMKKEME